MNSSPVMNSLNHLFRTLGQAFCRCATRFPVTTVFAFALTAFLCYLTATEATQASGKLLMTLGYYFSTGTLLSLSLHLWGEEVKRIRLRQGVHLTAQLLLAADALFLYAQSMEPRLVEIGIAHGAAILAIGLSVFFLPFFREKDDIPAWNFAQVTLGTLALVVIVGAVTSGGLSLLVFSLHQLFEVKVSYKCYLYILILCSLLLPLLMFLGLLPEGERKHDRWPQPTAFLQGTIRYLFVPLAALYLLVLYVYAGTILAQWELPDGWVSWLIVALMAGVIAIEGGLYPSRIKEHKATEERIARWLPLLALPLLVLMTVGIARRFQDYGITLNRLYLVTLNAWFYFVCIGLIAGQARRISWIPVSFSLVFLLTSALPVNYVSITRDVLRQEVQNALEQSGQDSLPLTTEAYANWLSSQSKEETVRINGKLSYLDDWFGEASTSDLVAEGTSFAIIVTEEDNPEGRYLNYHQTSGLTIELPRGYPRMTVVGYGQTVSFGDTITVLLNQHTDSLHLPLDSLRKWSHTGQLLLLPTTEGNVFMLTYYDVAIDIEYESMNISLNGYLFQHDEDNTM